jgi:hypothetical protein
MFGKCPGPSRHRLKDSADYHHCAEDSHNHADPLAPTQHIVGIWSLSGSKHRGPGRRPQISHLDYFTHDMICRASLECLPPRMIGYVVIRHDDTRITCLVTEDHPFDGSRSHYAARPQLSMLCLQSVVEQRKACTRNSEEPE